MQRPRTHLVLASLIVLFAASGGRADTVFVANMTNSQEVPPPGVVVIPRTSTGELRPVSFGTATLVLNDAQTALTMTAIVFNIDVTGSQTTDTFDNLTLAHIHAPAPPGSNAGVVWGFFGSPDNDTNPDNLVITPFAGGVGGVFTSVWNLPEGNNTTLTAQLPNIFGGLAYLNFHTVQFGGGEIRGQIQAVPEPATMLLLGTGLAGVGTAIQKGRKKRGK